MKNEHLKGALENDRTFTYLLGDDGGVSNCEDQSILLPIGSEFLHEYGLYKVIDYVDFDGKETLDLENVDSVYCERLKSNKELKEGE